MRLERSVSMSHIGASDHNKPTFDVFDGVNLVVQSAVVEEVRWTKDVEIILWAAHKPVK